MLSIACSTERARELLAPYGNRVSIAAVNGRSAVVVSGDVTALEELIGFCADLDLRTRRIDVDYASHSVEVEAIRGELAEVLAGIEPRSSHTAFFSTVTGSRLDTAGLDAEYWYRNIRQTVQLDQAVRNACEHGYRTFIESSPHPALIAGIEDTANHCATGTAGDSEAPEATVIPTLGRDDGGLERFLTSAATAFVAGVSVAWRGVLGGAGFVELPTYAFDRRRFWLSGEGMAADATGLGLGASEHPLLGAVVELPASGGVMLTGRLSPSLQGWLADHAHRRPRHGCGAGLGVNPPPSQRLRQAGVLELLLALANEADADGQAAIPAATKEKDIADMDLDALVNVALMDDE
jgi:mycoketide-CoA synthase